MGGCASKFEAPAGGQSDAGSISGNARDVQAFLKSIGLDIYAVSFQLAGINSQQQLQYLTEYELNRVELISHVPILPHHRQRILEASRGHTTYIAPPPAQPASMTTVQLFNAIMEESDEEDAEGNEAEAAGLQAHDTASTAIQPSVQTAHHAGEQQQQDHSDADQCDVMQDHLQDHAGEVQDAAPECLPGAVQQQAGPAGLGQPAVADSSALQLAATAGVQAPKQDATGPQVRLLQSKSAKVEEPAAAGGTAANAAVCDTAQDQYADRCKAGDIEHEQYQNGLQQEVQAVGGAASPAAGADIIESDVAQHQPRLLQRLHCGSWKSKRSSAAVPVAAAAVTRVGATAAEFPTITAGAGQHKQHSSAVDRGAYADAAGSSGGAGSSIAAATAQHSGFLQLLQLKSWKAKGIAADATPKDTAVAAIAAAGEVSAAARDLPTAVIPLQEDTEQQQQQLLLEPGATSAVTVSATAAAAVGVWSEGSVAALATTADPLDTAAVAKAGPAQLPAPGPLTTNKTALPKTVKLPPMPQRRTAPNAWAELPSEVANMAYALNAPLSVQPLPLPHTAAAHIAAAAPVAVGAWAELPGEVSSMSYAATASVSHSALQPPQKACGMPAESAAVQDALQIAGSSSSNHVLRGSLSANVLRFSSDPGSTGFQQQQQQQVILTGPQRYICSDSGQQQQQQQVLPSSCSAVSIAAASHPPAPLVSMSPMRSSRVVRSAHQPSAAAAVSSASLDLPPPVQHLHDTVMARLRAQDSASRSQQGRLATSVVTAAGAMGESSSSTLAPHLPPVPYTMKAPCQMLPSPRSLLHQEKGKEVTVALVKELVSPREGKGTLSRTAQAREQNSNSEQLTAQQSRNAVITSEKTSYSLPAQCSSAGMHTMLSQQQQLLLLLQPYAHQQLSGAISAVDVVAVPEQQLQQQQLAALAQSSGCYTGSPAMTPNLSRVSVTSSASAAGVPKDRRNSSRPGSRASDVSSIVARAKERAAARQQLPSAQQQVTPRAATPQTALLNPQQQQSQQLVSSMGAAATVPLTDAGAAGAAAAAAAGDMFGVRVESSSRCLSEESSSSSGVSAATGGAVGGDYALRMLQDYRTIAELDAAIKHRVSQLSTANTADVAINRSSRDGVNSSSGGQGVRQEVVGVRSKVASTAGSAPAASYETDIAIRSDARTGSKHQQHDQHGNSAAAVEHAGELGIHDGSLRASDSGLLGIKEALNNSFDTGKPRKPAGSAFGATQSRNWHGRDVNVRQSRSSAVPTPPGYRNPFLSPSLTATPEPAAAASCAQVQQQGSLQGLGWPEISSSSGMSASNGAASAAQGAEGVDRACGGAVHAAPALAVAGKGGAAGATALAASAAVDERIKRIVLASKARAAAAGAVAAQ